MNDDLFGSSKIPDLNPPTVTSIGNRIIVCAPKRPPKAQKRQKRHHRHERILTPEQQRYIATKVNDEVVMNKLRCMLREPIV